MAFDFSGGTQRIFSLNGGKMETGTLSFTTTSLTVEVPTKMTKILAGFGTTEDSTALWQDATITSGAVTFTRPSGGTSGASFSYVLIGW